MFRLEITPAGCFSLRLPFALFAFLALLLLWNVPAHAHKVTIFAWVEGDTIHTQSKFSGGRRVKNAPVEVYDAQGKKLLQGRTDDRGKFSFKSPGRGPLRIVLIAAMGHKASWTLSAVELADNVNPSKASTVATNPVATGKGAPPPPAPAATGKMMPVAELQTAVQTAVDKALDKKLQPVIELLVDARNPDPSFRDIVGGLGYILGLVGVGAYFNYRRKLK